MRISTNRLILGGLSFSCLILLYRLDSARSVVAEVRLEQQAMQDSVRSVSREREVLWKHLVDHSLTGHFLRGRIAPTGEMVDDRDVVDGVYMLMAERCGACPENYGFLNELSAVHHLNVVGLVPSAGVPARFQSTFESLSEHVTEHELRFPVVFEPSGSLLEVMPLWGTPLTLVFSEGELTYMVVGVFTEAQRARIREILAA